MFGGGYHQQSGDYGWHPRGRGRGRGGGRGGGFRGRGRGWNSSFNNSNSYYSNNNGDGGGGGGGGGWYESQQYYGGGGASSSAGCLPYYGGQQGHGGGDGGGGQYEGYSGAHAALPPAPATPQRQFPAPGVQSSAGGGIRGQQGSPGLPPAFLLKSSHGSAQSSTFNAQSPVKQSTWITQVATTMMHHANAVSRMNETMQKLGLPLPDFAVDGALADSVPTFTATVRAAGHAETSDRLRSKKDARTQAAERWFRHHARVAGMLEDEDGDDAAAATTTAQAGEAAAAGVKPEPGSSAGAAARGAALPAELPEQPPLTASGATTEKWATLLNLHEQHHRVKIPEYEAWGERDMAGFKCRITGEDYQFETAHPHVNKATARAEVARLAYNYVTSREATGRLSGGTKRSGDAQGGSAPSAKRSALGGLAGAPSARFAGGAGVDEDDAQGGSDHADEKYLGNDPAALHDADLFEDDRHGLPRTMGGGGGGAAGNQQFSMVSVAERTYTSTSTTHAVAPSSIAAVHARYAMPPGQSGRSAAAASSSAAGRMQPQFAGRGGAVDSDDAVAGRTAGSASSSAQPRAGPPQQRYSFDGHDGMPRLLRIAREFGMDVQKWRVGAPTPGAGTAGAAADADLEEGAADARAGQEDQVGRGGGHAVGVALGAIWATARTFDAAANLVYTHILSLLAVPNQTPDM